MGKHTSTFKFAGKASHPKNALVLMYDLEGFSRFFNQPDVQDYVPTFLNHVSEAMGVCLFGGDASGWAGQVQKKIDPLPLRVVHEKFLGDGALYIMMPPGRDSDFSAATLQRLCNRLWLLKTFFGDFANRVLDRVPVVKIPRRIRFGVSRGAVYELKKPRTTEREYIGFCINQASRLRDYCPDLGFIASARLMIPAEELKKYGYRKAVATKIRGFPNELVIVDSSEYDALPDQLRENLFKEPE